MSMSADKYGTAKCLTYTKADDNDPTHVASAGPKVNGIPVLRVEFEYDGEIYVHDVPNGEFNANNIALQFLSFVDAKPSDFDGQTLELERRIPLTRVGEDQYLIHQDAMDIGKDRFEDLTWSPLPNKSDDSEDDELDAEVDLDGEGMNITIE